MPVLKYWNGTSWVPISGSGGGSVLKILTNSVTLASNSASVIHGITPFNKDYDSLMVYLNSTYLAPTADYTISADGLSINKAGGGTWNTGDIIDIVSFASLQTESDALMTQLITNVITATAGQTKFTITEPTFDSVADTFQAFYNNVLLYPTDNYTMDADGKSINLVGFSLAAGEKIVFQILKKVRVPGGNIADVNTIVDDVTGYKYQWKVSNGQAYLEQIG